MTFYDLVIVEYHRLKNKNGKKNSNHRPDHDSDYYNDGGQSLTPEKTKKEYYLEFKEMGVFIFLAVVIAAATFFFVNKFDKKIESDKLVLREISSGKTDELRLRIKELQREYDEKQEAWNSLKDIIFTGTSSHLRGLTTLEVADDFYKLVKSMNFGAIEENREMTFEITRKQFNNLGRKGDFGVIPITVSMTATFSELASLFNQWSSKANRLWRLDELKIERDEQSMPYHKIIIEMERLGWIDEKIQ